VSPQLARGSAFGVSGEFFRSPSTQRPPRASLARLHTHRAWSLHHPAPPPPHTHTHKHTHHPPITLPYPQHDLRLPQPRSESLKCHLLLIAGLDIMPSACLVPKDQPSTRTHARTHALHLSTHVESTGRCLRLYACSHHLHLACTAFLLPPPPPHTHTHTTPAHTPGRCAHNSSCSFLVADVVPAPPP